MTESLLGRVFDGRYRVQSHIADGGMASVYLALDTRLDRDVALKILRRDLAQDDAFVSRFRREARSAARLSHPNVVSVFDQGEDEGHMFLAMEYVPGQTLREVMRAEGPLTPRAALDIMGPVLQALSAAHRAGIIHRDVKPENIILREDDGTVKVADFGLARAVTTQTTASQTGVLLGTVAYLSPEQVERGIADARSDVYAAGLILFEMLTGSKAFTGETPIHIAYQHVHGSVPAPSSRVTSVPTELDALVALATARDPDHRPTDAGDFLAEVRRSRAMLTATELDRRPEGPATPDGGVSTVAVDRTSALPVGSTGERARSLPPVALPIDRTPTTPPAVTAMATTARVPPVSTGALRRGAGCGWRSPSRSWQGCPRGGSWPGPGHPPSCRGPSASRTPRPSPCSRPVISTRSRSSRSRRRCPRGRSWPPTPVQAHRSAGAAPSTSPCPRAPSATPCPTWSASPRRRPPTRSPRPSSRWARQPRRTARRSPRAWSSASTRRRGPCSSAATRSPSS
ncbi:protein kinase [Nostocoides sp. HKS02]|nr:protein kinase [Tetrasphaera sp. HKS02]